MKITKLTLEQIDQVVELFDKYRIFYRMDSDLIGAKTYLTKRLSNKEAEIFLASTEEGEPLGFTLLYPCFSSVSMAPVYVLNDLFVDAPYRKKGIAAALMDAAAQFGRQNGAVRLHLETEITNLNAQRLYEKEGWVREGETYHYCLKL